MVEYEYIDPREWREFPPKSEIHRLNQYQTYKNLLLGNHREVFADGDAGKYAQRPEIAKVLDAGAVAMGSSCETYVMANYCGMASRIFANILFGKQPTISVGEKDAVHQLRMDKIITDNMLGIINHQQAINASAAGDAVYRIRWGKMLNWRKEGVIIEALPPGVYFPHITPGNVKDYNGATIAVPLKHAGQKYLYKEIHTPGQVRYELWRLDGNTLVAAVPLDTVPAYAHLLDGTEQYGNVQRDGDAVIYETGHPGLLVEHVPNWTLPDQFFGISDYSPDVIANQGAINTSLSGILRVILKHMDPKLVLPPGTLQYDEATGKWYALKEDMETIEVPAEVGAVLPRYVTWDAQLEAARANVDACFEAMMMSFQISPTILGWEKYGAADSAAALKLRMTLTLWNAGQKRAYFDAALKNILYAAQYLDGLYGPVRYEPEEVSITWPEPLPIDDAANTTMHIARYAGGVQSLETTVKAVQAIDGDALTDELARITADAAGEAERDPLKAALNFASRDDPGGDIDG